MPGVHEREAAVSKQSVLKQGDRVRVYGCVWYPEREGTRWCGGPSDIWTGRVVSASPMLVRFVDDDGGGVKEANPRQCRRLKKRERRRVWVQLVRGMIHRIHGSKPDDNSVWGREGGWVEFVEVKKRG